MSQHNPQSNALPYTSIKPEAIKAVFTDLDGTLTDEESRLGSDTYKALWDLKKAGLWLTLVTGRPAGWADCLIRLWPVDAVIFENGAGIVRRTKSEIEMVNFADTSELELQRQHLEKLFQGLKKKFPAARLAKDQTFRRFDYAVDYAEDSPRLDEKTVDGMMAFLKADKDITVKLSSIHINYWYGKHTKVTACERLLAGLSKESKISRDNVIYVGDSPNDEPLFEYFPYSVGVSNVSQFLDKMTSHPRFLTNSPSGKGFVELSRHLLSRSS